MKAMLNINSNFVKKVIENRPYVSWLDFYNKVSPTKREMVSLIKGGAFDSFGKRKTIMAEYLYYTCDKKNKLTLQNMSTLIKFDLIPHTNESEYYLKFYEFNRYLKDKLKYDIYFKLDDRAKDFLIYNDLSWLFLNPDDENNIVIFPKDWDNVYQAKMDYFRAWMQENEKEILYNLNKKVFELELIKYGGDWNISAWEMETLCFYYNTHELYNINKNKYGISDFSTLPEKPVIDYVFKKGKNEIPIYKLTKICGTCIAKDKRKSIVYLLTPDDEVVPIRFRKEYFSLFDKQISQKQSDGKSKKVIEKSWFNRGEKIIVQGYRREDNFVPKKYSKTPGHQLYLIKSIDKDGNIELTSERADTSNGED